MDIFDSVPKRLWHKYRSLSKGIRLIIYTGVLLLVILFISLVFLKPMQPLEQEAQPETVAEAIERLGNQTQGSLPLEDYPPLIKDIDTQFTRTDDIQELAKLYVLKSKVYFNVELYKDAIAIGKEALDKNIVKGQDRFSIYSIMVFSYEQLGDMEQRRHFAQIMVDEFNEGKLGDTEFIQYYNAVAEGYF